MSWIAPQSNANLSSNRRKTSGNPPLIVPRMLNANCIKASFKDSPARASSWLSLIRNLEAHTTFRAVSDAGSIAGDQEKIWLAANASRDS